MEANERTFTIRFSLSAVIPDALWNDDRFEEDEWLKEWETQLKPALIRTVFTHLRSFPNWQAHIRNRGISPEDEIEIVVERCFAPPPKPD
jgi:ribosomal protein L11 methylase PrmA